MLTINKKDNTGSMHGISTGKITLKGYNDRMVAVHIAGHKYWSSIGSYSYAPAEMLVMIHNGIEETVNELKFNVSMTDFLHDGLRWNPRGENAK